MSGKNLFVRKEKYHQKKAEVKQLQVEYDKLFQEASALNTSLRKLQKLNNNLTERERERERESKTKPRELPKR